jgi:hypothetical protein
MDQSHLRILRIHIYYQRYLQVFTYSSSANVTGKSSLAYIEQPMASHVALGDCWITTQ